MRFRVTFMGMLVIPFNVCEGSFSILITILALLVEELVTISIATSMKFAFYFLSLSLL